MRPSTPAVSNESDFIAALRCSLPPCRPQQCGKEVPMKEETARVGAPGGPDRPLAGRIPAVASALPQPVPSSS